MEAFSPDGTALENPHDVGDGGTALIRCTFPSHLDNVLFPTQIIIYAVKESKEIVQVSLRLYDVK